MTPLPPVIIGTGPAALVAAHFLCKAGLKPQLFERRAAPGWKLLVAGSSGLNVSYEADEMELANFYFSRNAEISKTLLRFPRSRWLELLHDLDEETFVGTSRRHFLKKKTAAQLLQTWTAHLEKSGASFHLNAEFTCITKKENTVVLTFKNGTSIETQTALLALGGASWENEPPAWPKALREAGVVLEEFSPSNTGYHLAAPAGFFAEAEGKPIKGAILRTKRGEKQGEMMITKYGLEGTPVYTLGCSGAASFDLKPELPEEKLRERLSAAGGPMWQRILNTGKLSEGALLLLKHLAPPGSLDSPATAASAIKNFPIELLEPRPLSESISSRGGVAWSELTEDLEIKKLSGVFCAGEMIDWDAPTGGFLLQACASTGFVAAEGMRKKLGI